MQGYRYRLKSVYAHFPINVNVNGNDVEIRNFLGEKIVRKIGMLEGVTCNVVQGAKDEIEVFGNDIENVSRSAALISQSCRVRNKDIRKFLDGIYVSSKGTMLEDKSVI